MTSIPRAATLSLWVGAWLRGMAGLDELLASFDPAYHHVFVGLDPAKPLEPIDALAAIRLLDTRVSLALTAPGDPAGLAGPPSFNTAAMDAGEAVLLLDARLGLVPVFVGGALEWRCQPADPPVPADRREARQLLNSTLREVTAELAELQVATWSTEIPDILINPQSPLHLPAGLSIQDAEVVSSAVLCLEVTDAAARIEPGAINAWERSRFEDAMRRLSRAARHALVAVCGSASDSLTSP